MTPPRDPHHVLLNWGANDVSALPAEATWNANYLAIIDAVHSKWPTSQVWIMRPWRRGFATESATLAARITTIQSARGSFVSLGPDEAIWLEGGDDGVTMSSDGIHYSMAGENEAAAQWFALLGY